MGGSGETDPALTSYTETSSIHTDPRGAGGCSDPQRKVSASGLHIFSMEGSIGPTSLLPVTQMPVTLQRLGLAAPGKLGVGNFENEWLLGFQHSRFTSF